MGDLRWPAAVFAAAALAGLAGCDGDADGERVGRHVVTETAVVTANAGGARVEVEVETRIPGVDEPVPIRGEGVVDVRRGRASLVLDMSELAGVAGAEGEDGGDESFRVEEVVDGHELYLRFPALAQALDPSRPWLRIDRRERVESAAELDLSQIVQAATDPAATVDRLRAAADPAERFGREDVRGAATTRYRATIDLRRYPARVPARERKDAARAVARLVELTGVERVPTEVWVDELRRVRRVRARVDGKGPAGERVELETTVELFDFGIAASVAVPADREVTDLDELSEPVE
jgi:hypothetical protein